MTAGAGPVAVVGGGLAGISAALRLADAGRSVTLLEAKPRLGGLTASFRRGELEVDTGQHVFMRCCTSYLDLLDRLGVREHTVLQRRLDVPVVRAADGRRGRIFRDPFPVLGGMPLHLTRSLTRYRLLRRRDRLAAARAVLALRRLDPADPALDRRSFGEWLEARGQSVAAVEALWDLVGVATLNAGAADASLSLAATVFQVGLLTASDAADLGWSLVPLQRLHGEAAEAALRRAGVDHRRSTRVRELRPTAGAWWVGADTGGLQAAAVVVAVEPAQAERLLPADALDLPAGWSARLGETPIVNVHAIFDRPVMREPFLACAGSPLQWLFDRTVPAGLRGGGQYLAASISAATAVADRPVARLRAELIPELERVLPAARQAELRDFFVTREPHATFRQSPDSARWRPSATTRHRGLVLAGAHTATGWPATMEGAVRSGVTAAEALLATTPARQREGVAA